jgi:diadenosine tetraphosphate (Ap4A) HIT family hydrolase
MAPLLTGKSPKLVARLPSGFVVMGDAQFLPGYVLLLAYPYVSQLNDLEPDARRAFLVDMSLVGDAVRAATGAKRINYSIYGNQDPFLHAHVVPRFDSEDPGLATLPPLSIPAEIRDAPVHSFDLERHGAIRDRIRDALLALDPARY